MEKTIKEYYLSDCNGGPSSPFESLDPDALIAQDVRGRPQQSRCLEFDINSAPLIADHIVRQVTHLVDAQKSRNGILRLNANVRVFANAAPRIEKAAAADHEANGSHFYVAELDSGVRLVVTPLSVLSSIKDRVVKLFKLPNTDNGLFPNGEQFRSSYTPVLFNVDLDKGEQSGIQLEQCDPAQAITDYHAPWHLAYVDRFGNCVTYDHANQALTKFSTLGENNPSCTANLKIGETTQRILRGSNLNEALSGKLTFYPNDFRGNLDVIRKHLKSENLDDQQQRSAWSAFDRAPIGALVVLSNITDARSYFPSFC